MVSVIQHSARGIYILALMPIMLALGFISGVIPPALTLDTTLPLWTTVSLVVLYAVSIYYARPLQTHTWQTFVAFTASVVGLSHGLGPALYIIIVIPILVETFRQFQLSAPISKPLADRIIGWISYSGTIIILQHLLYVVALNQKLPYQMLDLTAMALLVIAVGIGQGISMVIHSHILGISFIDTFQERPTTTLLFEILLLFFATTLALLSWQVDELVYIIIVGFIIAHLVNRHQTTVLKEKSQAQLNELTTLNAVANTLSRHLRLDDVLDSIHTEVIKLVNADLIFIALFDETTKSLSYPLVKLDGQPQIWNDSPLTDNLTSSVVRNKEVQQVSESDINQLVVESDVVSAKSYLGIPMLIGDKIIGVMGFINQDATDTIVNTNLDVLQSIANQASLALRNATLYNRTTQLADNLSHINHSVQDVMFNFQKDEALVAAAQTAKEVSNGDRVGIYLIDLKDQAGIQLVQSIDLSPAFQHKVNSNGDRLFAHSNGHFQLVSHIADLDNPHIIELSQVDHFTSFAEVPMRSGNVIVGYIVIYHEQPRYYSNMEIELLEMLSTQVTVALDNSELLQALELYASEQAELVHLSTITSSSLEIEQVIQDVSIALGKMLKAQHVKIGLYMQEKDFIQIYSTQEHGYLNIDDYELTYIPELNIVTKETDIYPHILTRSDNISDGLHEFLNTGNYETITISPMVINNEVIGVIIVTDTQERIFMENQRRLVEMATVQIGAQIHNAQIHTLTEEALVKRLEQLSLIEDIGQKISRSLDLDIIINNVLDAALRSTQAELASLSLIKDDETVILKVKILQPEGEAKIFQFERHIYTGIIGDVIKTGSMQIIDDNRLAPNYVPPRTGQVFLSSLAVPLTKGSQIIGVLNVESPHRAFFTDEHVGFVKSLTGHAIISIDNAKLLEDSKRRIDTLSQLRVLALTASGKQSTEDMIHTIIETSVNMMDANGGIILPYNEEAKELKTHGTLGWIKLGNSLVQDIFFIPDTLLYQSLHADQTIFVNNTENNERYQQYEQADQVHYKSIVIMPIKRRNKVTELLCIIFKKSRDFDTQDKNTVQLLQAQVANHIETVTLSEEIRESNVRMRAILDSTRDGIILLDSDKRLQDANISAEELLNVELSQFRNQDFATVLIKHSYSVDDDASYTELIKTAKATYEEPGRNHIREYTLNSSGKTIYIREVSSPVWNTNNQIVGRLLSLRDVSEERAIEEFRLRLQSMIIHDLRGPLSAIISSMVLGKDVLKDVNDPDIAEELEQLMDVAQDSSGTLIEFVESMLDIGKLQRKTMDLNIQNVTVRELAENAYTSLMASFRQANVKMTYDIPSHIPDVMVDERLVGRVFINLLQNALKYTPRDGEIRVTAEQPSTYNGFINILVSDTGPGIPEDKHEQIFAEFTVLDEKTQKKQRGPRGQGLGLTFCKLTIEEHGGSISVADHGPLPGATFIFTLPIATQ